MKNAGLTLTIVAELQSANFGEGFGNIATLKKLTRGNGLQYTYISRQALRYSLVKQLGWDDTPIEAQGSGEKQVCQFAPDTTIEEYPEIDLFGYMKTKKDSAADTRSAVVRLSDAISLEPFKGDLDFLTNMGLAKRVDASNSLAQSEQHKSLYSYTITIELDRVGIDGDIEISQEEKARRVLALLEEVEFLNRDIRGRRESFNPIFVIGGVYRRKNAFFQDRVVLKGLDIDVEPLKSIKNSYDWLKNETFVGVLPSKVNNYVELQNELGATEVPNVFQSVAQKVREFYGI